MLFVSTTIPEDVIFTPRDLSGIRTTKEDDRRRCPKCNMRTSPRLETIRTTGNPLYRYECGAACGGGMSEPTSYCWHTGVACETKEDALSTFFGDVKPEHVGIDPFYTKDE